MRKLLWQRWTLIFLLVTRLVIGELGHAMPVPTLAAVDHATAMMTSMAVSDSAECPDHEGDARQMPTSHPASDSMDDGASHHSSGEQDCCKSGDCECPCLHIPCAALGALVLSPVATTLLRVPSGTDGLISQRPSGLFRPPA